MTKRISAALELRGKQVHCGKCGHDLGPAERAWKAGALVREQPRIFAASETLTVARSVVTILTPLSQLHSISTGITM